MMSTFNKLQHLKFGGILSQWKIYGFYTTCCRLHIASLGQNELSKCRWHPYRSENAIRNPSVDFTSYHTHRCLGLSAGCQGKTTIYIYIYVIYIYVIYILYIYMSVLMNSIRIVHYDRIDCLRYYESYGHFMVHIYPLVNNEIILSV